MSEPTALNFCPTCGTQRITGQRYCANCGLDYLKQAQVPEQESQPTSGGRRCTNMETSCSGAVLNPLRGRMPAVRTRTTLSSALTARSRDCQLVVPTVIARPGAQRWAEAIPTTPRDCFEPSGFSQ